MPENHDPIGVVLALGSAGGKDDGGNIGSEFELVLLEAVNRGLVSARDTVALANERYQKGLTSYLDVVDAEREALKAERQDVQLRGDRAVSTILLAKALGGGWEQKNATELAAK